jgi:hypothetical protein
MKKISSKLFVLSLLLASIYGQPAGELFFSFVLPLGNVAVTQHQVFPIQYFFSVHPESKPKGPKIYKIEHGIAKSFPDSALQFVIMK